jgi:hypothetical protein
MEFAYVVRPAFDRAFLARATPDQREVVQKHGDWLEARCVCPDVPVAGSMRPGGGYGWEP